MLFIPNSDLMLLAFFFISQAQSVKLIGEAVQQNPAFITLRKIEASI
jgi:hypothetical protein